MAFLCAIAAVAFHTVGDGVVAVLLTAVASVAVFAAARERRSFAAVMAMLVALPLIGQVGALRSDRTFFETDWSFIADGVPEVRAASREVLRKGATGKALTTDITKELGYDYLLDISSIDNMGSDPRWEVVYEPAALCEHRRRSLPSTRRQMPPHINMHSLKNRYLLRFYHQSGVNLVLTGLPALARDLAALA